MGRLQTERALVNNGHGSVSSMAFDLLTKINQLRAEQAGPVRLGPAPATPSLAPVIDVPSQRDQKQEMEIVTIACANTLREQLEEATGDRLDLSVALDISAAILNTYYDAKLALVRGRK